MEDQYISIDIFIPKLLEWLLSRRHCVHDWQSSIVPIRSKINEAIQDMPENKEIAALLSGTYINYFHCLKIVDILKTTEGDSKNIFGQYSSKRLKDWQEIINLYKKKNVYLAEGADLLINSVKYEVPNIKKLIAKQDQLENEYKKKETDAIKSGNSAKNELASFLKELGLDGSKKGFRDALLSKAKELNTMNDHVASNMKNVLPVIEHYSTFIEYSQPNQTIDLTHIKYLAEKGNTTTYEWTKGVKPTKIILPVLAAEQSPEQNDDGIDWGYDAGQSDDFEIEVIDSNEVKDEKSGIKEEHNENEIVAEGEMALSVLDNSVFRTNLINQLLEIQNFVKARLYELEQNISLDAIFESDAAVKEMSVQVSDVINSITNTTTQHYFNILYYPSYLEDILKKIEDKESSIERYAAVASMAKDKAADAAKEAINLNQKAQIIIKKSKELKNELCQDISQKYNGREVNLMGGTLLN